MRFAYGIVLSTLESVATEIKRYKSGIEIGIDSMLLLHRIQVLLF